MLTWPDAFGSPPDSPAGQPRRARSAILPGIIAGAADLDPAAVMTAVVAGATFRYSLGWVVIAAIPVLMTVFSVSARLGDEARKGLVQLIRDHYGKLPAIVMAAAMVAVNMAMIIADLRAVSDAFSIITRLPYIYFLAPVMFSVWWILVKGNFQRVTKAIAALAMAQLAYIAAAVLATHSPITLLRGLLLPRLAATPEYAIGVIAVFGSLLTPDVIVWQTSSRKDTNQAKAEHGAQSRAGTLVACVISLSAMVSASVLSVHNPGDLTTRSAAEALAPLGTVAPILFSLGIIGSGLVALPVLIASMCFSIAEAARWNSGLEQNPWEAKFFYVLMSLTAVIAAVVNYGSLNTVRVLYLSQLIAGMLTVPVLWFILRLANDRRIMKRTNTHWQNFWLGGAIGGTVSANVIFLWSLFR